MIIVHGRATSSNVQAVMWCTAELGLAVDRRDVGGAYGGTDTPEYRAMNPNRVIPTVEIDETVLWESATIVRCLSEMHGDATFWPRDPLARARLDKWAEWGKTTLAPRFQPFFLQLIFARPENRNQAMIDAAQPPLAAALAILDAHLAGSKWIGEAFSYADIVPGVLMYRLHELDMGVGEFPNVSRWYRDLAARAPYAEHAMVPFDVLRPT